MQTTQSGPFDIQLYLAVFMGVTLDAMIDMFICSMQWYDAYAPLHMQIKHGMKYRLCFKSSQ